MRTAVLAILQVSAVPTSPDFTADIVTSLMFWCISGFERLRRLLPGRLSERVGTDGTPIAGHAMYSVFGRLAFA